MQLLEKQISLWSAGKLSNNNGGEKRGAHRQLKEYRECNVAKDGLIVWREKNIEVNNRIVRKGFQITER